MKDFTAIISSCKFGQLSISEANKMINEQLEAKNLQQAHVIGRFLPPNKDGYQKCTNCGKWNSKDEVAKTLL